MKKKTTPANARQAEKNEALLEAEKLLEELIAEDPRLRVARKQARYSDNGNGEHGIGEDTVQIYRQRLRE